MELASRLERSNKGTNKPLDDLPPNARALLDAIARTDDPTPDERARADARVRAALRLAGLGDLPTLAPRMARASLSSSFRDRLGLLAGSLIGFGALAVLVLQPLVQPNHSAPSAPPLPAALSPHRTSSSERNVEAPAPPPARPLPKSQATGTPVQQSTRTTLDDDALQRELRIVASADALIRAGRFADALRMLGAIDSAAHVLQEERNALRILAWCGQGPDERALRARERFLQTSPQAVLSGRVRDACKPAGEGLR